MATYGTERYGFDRFGRGSQPFDPFDPMRVVSVEPLDRVTIRVTYSEAMRWTNSVGPDDASNPANYTVTNTFGTLTVHSVSIVSAKKFDLIISEMISGINHDLVVDEMVENLAGRPFSEEVVSNPDANKGSFTGVSNDIIDPYPYSPYGVNQYSEQGYGREKYSYDPFLTLRVISAVPQDKITIRVKYSKDMRRTDPNGYDDVTNPANYTITHPAGTVTILRVVTLSPTTFDLVVAEMLIGASHVLTVDELVETEAGRPFADELYWNPTANQATFIGIGLVPAISLITNPAPGFLKLVFNKAMFRNDEIDRASNYTITPAESDAVEATTLRLVVAEDTPNEALLQFEGGVGGGSYYLTVTGGILDLVGNEIDPGPYTFNIYRPGVDELFIDKRYFLETVLGAIQFTINPLSTRNIEDLTILRTMDKGYEKQFQNIYEALKRNGINKDETRLKLFGG